MAKCRDCDGWGFAGKQSYREGEGFSAKFVPLRPCDTCNGTGGPTEKEQPSGS